MKKEIQQQELMSNIQIYDEKKQSLTELAFVKDTYNQVKVRDIPEYDFLRQLGQMFTAISYGAGIKDVISDFDKKDIKELILRKYKNLSLDEISYAFKLERHGDLGEKTQHFQLFNADYVNTVLTKYREWKRTKLATHNISAKPKEITFSESEKQRLTSNAIRKSLDYFLEHLTIPKDYVFVYDELYAQGFLNQSKEFKKQIYEDAIELLETELKEKKAANKDEHLEIKNVLEGLREPKQPLVIMKCKELSMINFFRSLRRDEKALLEFQDEYKIVE